MTDVRRSRLLITSLLGAALMLVACGTPGGSGAAPTSSVTGGDSVMVAGHPTHAGSLSPLKMATVFSGSVTDGDFSHLGLLALQAVENEGAIVTYTENVAVTEAEQVLRDYVAKGNNVIWTHGSQFFPATVKIAAENPDVHFIAETGGHPAGLPANVWTLDWQFQLGFYALGVLAGKLSRTGKIGYVGGLSLPFSNAEVHAMQQAITDLGIDAAVAPVWTGDFNDPVKAQRITTQLIDDGADVIVGSLNNGAIGTFEAAEAAGAGVWVTAKYTDKSELDTGGHYAGTVLYDFTPTLMDVLSDMLSGENSGYYGISFSTGMMVSVPDSVPADVREAVLDTMSGVEDGSIDVIRDTSKIGG
jgi:basic membrane protein A